MLLRNNSMHEWLQYDCGNTKVDIHPFSEFETDEFSANIILRNLGCPQWVVEVTEQKVLPKAIGCEVCGSKGWRHKKGCTKV